MSSTESILPLDSFATFGDLLKYLRRRARLTQREVAIAVGYSEAQVSRLEQNLRPPDLATLMALFIPALYIDDEPEVIARLMELAAQTRGERLPASGVITFSRAAQREVLESVRTVEENVRNNLPLQLTSFIGRERELAAILNLLNVEKKKLVTLTGAGGCGKTRLALEAAGKLSDSYPDGIWLVELASILDPRLVLQTILSLLGVPESRDSDPASPLIRYLRAKRTLLILDNCEQFVSAVARAAEEILRACPRVQILATSREVLNVPGEIQFRVDPLSLPQEKSPSESEAVQLFADRARTVLPSFHLSADTLPAVAQICRLVDGMPLGIELAAAKVTVLSVGQIAARLQESFHVLGEGKSAVSQGRTLEAAIQWSYNLLSEEERTLLERLCAFSGGWTLEAAESVASDEALIPEDRVLDLLTQLVNKSLVVVDLQTQTDARYRLLRIVRQFGWDRLAQRGERDATQNRLMDFLLRLVKQANAGLMTPHSPQWLDRLDNEQDNLRAALAYGLSSPRIEDALRLASGLFWYWQTRGHISEGRSHLEAILSNASQETRRPDTGSVSARAEALWAAGSLAWIQADYEQARSHLDESIALWRQLDEEGKSGLAVSLREVGIVATYQGELEYAHAILLESIRFLKKIGGGWNLALAFYNFGLIFEAQGNLPEARTNYEQSLALFRKAGEPWGLSVSLNGFGRIAARQADYATARRDLEESLALSRTMGDTWGTAGNLYLLGEVSLRQNDMEPAAEFFLESLALNRVVGDRAMIGFTLHNLAKIAQQRGETDRAACLFSAGQSLRQDEVNTTSWSLTDHAQCEQDIHSLRALMEPTVFDPAWWKGQMMSMDQAIESVLF